MKNPEELKISLGTGADVTALVYPSEEPTAPRLVDSRATEPARVSAVRFWCRSRARLSARGLDIVTFNFPTRNSSVECPTVGRCSTRVTTAIIRGIRRAGAERARRALHRRQIDGRADRHARGGGRSGSSRGRPRAARISAASAGQTHRTPRRPPRRRPPADADRSGKPRHVRNARGVRFVDGRALADADACTSWKAAITPSRSAAVARPHKSASTKKCSGRLSNGSTSVRRADRETPRRPD